MRSVPKSTVWYTARAAHKPRYCTCGRQLPCHQRQSLPRSTVVQDRQGAERYGLERNVQGIQYGHRLEVYLSPEHAEEVIAISKSFNIDAQIVGRVEESDKKELIIKSEFGEFKY